LAILVPTFSLEPPQNRPGFDPKSCSGPRKVEQISDFGKCPNFRAQKCALFFSQKFQKVRISRFSGFRAQILGSAPGPRSRARGFLGTWRDFRDLGWGFPDPDSGSRISDLRSEILLLVSEILVFQISVLDSQISDLDSGFSFWISRSQIWILVSRFGFLFSILLRFFRRTPFLGSLGFSLFSQFF
jgi:hypothetical protein